MAWKKGVSGKPAGKAQGTRHKATTMLLTLMEQNAESITKTVIEAAQNGDLTAARMILDRLAPPAKERPVLLALPETGNAEGISAAQQYIVQAVACGNLLPGEGATLSGIVEARRKAIETLQLDQRITALEEHQNAKN
jgi:hypothetical protein